MINPSPPSSSRRAPRALKVLNTTVRLDLLRAARLVMPRTPNQLHAYIRSVIGFDMPRVPLIEGHDAPFDYVQHAYFEEASTPNRDCIVWANRGGGKTQIAAVATLLDLLFKPGIDIRILGGSFDQSSRMYRYLKRILEHDVFSDLIAGNLTGRHVELVNGSRVEVVSQSECSVRGLRVHKLRCDEVELFDRDIWEAAQLVTRSGRCGDIHVRAAVEAFSTMHRPFGLMQRLVNNTGHNDCRVFRWNIMDTLKRCPEARPCEGCVLWDDCAGRAKLPIARGFFDIDDAVVQKQRVDPLTWAAEMLCERPSLIDSVYAEFDPAIHIVHELPEPSGRETWIGGIDFGYRAPTVLLIAFIDEDDRIWIVDELTETNCMTEEFIAKAVEMNRANGWAQPLWIGADPAGHQRNEQTGESTIAVWRRAGWKMRTRPFGIEAGIELVRRRLRRADGEVHLRIHARCVELIGSLAKYHYPSQRPEDSVPVKDGPDHAADALRYMIVNLDCAVPPVAVKRYP